jgi:hypothetical protein
MWYLVQTDKSQPCWKSAYQIDEWVMLEFQNRDHPKSPLHRYRLKNFYSNNPGIISNQVILA